MPDTNDPRNLNVAKSQRIESVHANPYSGGSTVQFRILERVAGIRGGTGVTDFVETSEVTDWLEFYVRTSHLTAGGGGDPHVLKAYLSVYGVALWGGVCAQFITRIDTPTATGQVGNAGGLDVWTTVGAGANKITGMLYGGMMMVGAENHTDALAMSGGYHALVLVGSYGTNVTVIGVSSYIRCEEWGGGDDTHYLFDFDPLTADAAHAIEQDTGAVGTPWGYARVLCPDASVGYLVIYDGHS